MPKPLRYQILAVAVTPLVVLGTGCARSPGTGKRASSTTAATVSEQVVEAREEWGAVFADANATGTLAMREVGSDTTMVWSVESATEPRLPASTFKILNSLIVLETGVLPDAETVVPWDGVERDVTVWNQDHCLRTGIEASAVWAYQELAREVGRERMQQWVTRADYGSHDIGDSIDQFWLSGDLRISPLEQLDFLERLSLRELPFRTEVQDSVSEILVRESGDDRTWSHKTGSVPGEDPNLGWLVGMSEHDGRTFVFAMNLDLESVTGVAGQLDPRVRQNITREILRGEGALPS